MKSDLDSLLNEMGIIAHDMLIVKKMSQLLTSWLLVNDEGEVTIIATPWEDVVAKKFMVTAVKQHILSNNIVSYAMVTEAWSARVDQEEVDSGADLLPASERVDKQEVVMAVACNKDKSRFRQWLIIRNWEDQIVELRLDPLSDFDSMESWLADLLKEED